MKAVGSKVPDEDWEKLRWLAWRNHTTVSAIIAGYIARCLPGENLAGYPAEQVHAVLQAAGGARRCSSCGGMTQSQYISQCCGADVTQDAERGRDRLGPLREGQL